MRLVTIAKRSCEKLAAQFYGPFHIVEKIGAVAYKLKITSNEQRAPSFSRLPIETIHGSITSSAEIPTQLDHDLELVAEEKSILGVKKKGPQSQHVDVILITWRRLPISEESQQDYHNICNQFPSFYLEDKVIVWEGGNVTNDGQQQPTLKFTYSRRGRTDMSHHNRK